MHQNLAIIIRQFNDSKISFIVLIRAVQRGQLPRRGRHVQPCRKLSRRWVGKGKPGRQSPVKWTSRRSAPALAGERSHRQQEPGGEGLTWTGLGVLSSVTRFGNFLPLWQNLESFGQCFESLFSTLEHFVAWIPGLIKEGGTCCGMGMSGTYKYGQPGWNPGTDPIKILQRKFYATQFFQDCDWLKIFRIQSEFLKNFAA